MMRTGLAGRQSQMRRLSVCLLCAGMLLVVAAPGLADRAALHDRNDAFGRLDVRTITQGHLDTSARRMLLHRIDTFGTWDKDSLRHEGAYIHILFTTDADNRPERMLNVDTVDNRLVAEMRSWRKKGVGETIYGHARVSRPDNKSVRVVFPRKLLGRGVDEYGWHVDTQFHKAGHPHCGTERGVIVVCPDSAPNDTKPYAYLRHQL